MLNAINGRYSRQACIKNIGSEGQKKLKAASVAVVGAGGLGSPALTYLAAAGVGHISIIDFDKVSMSNLNRQFLHAESDIGFPKAVSAKKKLTALNSEIEITSHEETLTNENAKSLLAGCDLVIGAVDSFDTRFIINRASIELNLPYIDGGITGFYGSIIFSQPQKTPCLNCIFPEEKTNKETTGVLGTTAGVIGTLEANLAILWLICHENKIENKLLLYDGLKMSMDLIDIKRDENCPVCQKDFSCKENRANKEGSV